VRETSNIPCCYLNLGKDKIIAQRRSNSQRPLFNNLIHIYQYNARFENHFYTIMNMPFRHRQKSMIVHFIQVSQQAKFVSEYGVRLPVLESPNGFMVRTDFFAALVFDMAFHLPGSAAIDWSPQTDAISKPTVSSTAELSPFGSLPYFCQQSFYIIFRT
jgi:hypothetical protein